MSLTPEPLRTSQIVLGPRGERHRQPVRDLGRGANPLDGEPKIVDRLAGSPVASSIEPPTMPVAAVRRVISAAARGSSA
jgi:hypothetical protein